MNRRRPAGRRVVSCSSVWQHMTCRKKNRKNSCDKWCPKFKATSIRIHSSAWWIIEQQPEQPWVLALFCDGFCMNKTLFGLQSCLLCRNTALCSNMEIALGIVLCSSSAWFAILHPCITNSACLSASALYFHLPACPNLGLCHFSFLLLYYFSPALFCEKAWTITKLDPCETVKNN